MKAAALTGKVEYRKYVTFLDSFKRPALNVGLIIVGSVIFVIGMNGILVPQEFLSGGFVGISLLIHYLIPSASVGWIYFIINIPLMILAWRNISRSFMLYSIIGMAFFSLVAFLINPSIPEIEDPILAALAAGVVCGTGAGLILRSFGSAGGMDVLGVYLNKKFGFRIGTIIFMGNISVLLAGVYFYDIQIALYSIMYLFTSGKVTDAILTGFNRRKAMIVISDETERIAEVILNSRDRGVTFLKGEGAFSGKDKKVIFTITTLRELPKMKETILTLDPDAFIVINDTLEVLGKRHGTGRVY